jgi:hypothetical protein
VLPLYGEDVGGTLFDAAAPGRTRELMVENEGHRGFRRGDWEVVTCHELRTPFSEDRWELFDMASDPSQVRDLAAEQPQRLAEMVAAWEDAAWDNQVFPLYEGNRLKYYLKPPGLEVFSRPVRLSPRTPTLERWRAAQLITGRSFRIVVDWAYRPGDQGILVAHGGQEAGYVLYVEDGALHFVQNQHGTPVPLPAVPLGEASAEVVVDVTAPGGGAWDVELLVDGESRARAGGFVQFSGFLPFEGIDVGLDRRSPVSWDLFQRHGSFPFTGALTDVTYRPGEVAPDAAQRLVDEARRVGIGLE